MRVQYIYTQLSSTQNTNHHHHISVKRRRRGSNERSRNGGELAHSSGPLLRPQRNDRRHFPPIKAQPAAAAEKRLPLPRPSPVLSRTSQSRSTDPATSPRSPSRWRVSWNNLSIPPAAAIQIRRRVKARMRRRVRRTRQIRRRVGRTPRHVVRTKSEAVVRAAAEGGEQEDHGFEGGGVVEAGDGRGRGGGRGGRRVYK